MSLDYIRQVVSGNKARYVDAESNIDLDLVYVTDRIVLMGWPATGFASGYRNRRRDVLKFLDGRHGDKWWVWNLCPLYENAYSAESMHHRVSRYPFPDHHPPPLALLPLAVKEMTQWLDKDPENIAIIHCKAGKGRSGTLLCSYLLSLDELPPPPQSILSYSSKERAAIQDKGSAGKRDGWILVGAGEQVDNIEVRETDSEELEFARPPSSCTTLSDSVFSDTISYTPIGVGEADVARMDQYDRKDGRVDRVFKLHSSRRMKPTTSRRGVSIPSQRRWCRYINLHYTAHTPSASGLVRMVSITLKLKAPHSWQKPIAKLVVGGDGGQGKAWASVARYDDGYVEKLRSVDQSSPGGVGGDGEYDTSKMFRACGKLTASSSSPQGDHIIHRLECSEPLLLDRDRECRIKLHLSSLPLGWAWFIPAFHLPEPSTPGKRHVLLFPHSQIDFAVGPGAAIVDVAVELEEISKDAEGAEPAHQLSEQQERQAGLDEKDRVKEEGE